jgi:hypothetical protein
MKATDLSLRMAAGGMILPLVRPIPFLLAAARYRGENPRGRLPKGLAAEFREHVQALAETVEVAARLGLRDTDAGDLARAIRSLANGLRQKPETFLPALQETLRRLEAFGRAHRDRLRELYQQHPEALQEPYGRLVTPRVVGLWGFAEDPVQTGRLTETLVARCQYRVERVPTYGVRGTEPTWSVVAIAPTEEKIPDDLLEQLQSLGKPLAAFVKVRPTKDRFKMSVLRSTHTYHRMGIEVIHPPHNALRIFPVLDGMDFAARFGKTGAAPSRAAHTAGSPGRKGNHRARSTGRRTATRSSAARGGDKRRRKRRT